MPKFAEMVDGTWINLDTVTKILIDPVMTPDERPRDPNTDAVMDPEAAGPQPTGSLRILAIVNNARIVMAVKPTLEDAKVYISNLSN
jgi:hypothetical protein